AAAARAAGCGGGLDLHVLADARRLHHARARRRRARHGADRLDRRGERRAERPARRCAHRGARGDHGLLPPGREAAGRLRSVVSGPPLMETRNAKIGLGIWTLGVVAFLWLPLIVIAIYAFNNSQIQSWP